MTSCSAARFGPSQRPNDDSETYSSLLSRQYRLVSPAADLIPGRESTIGIPSIRAAPRRRARISPPAQVAPQPKVDAALAAWRAGDGSWNLGAVDRAIAGGTASVAFGFFGLLVLDVLALVFFGGAAKSLIFDAGA